MRLIESVGGSPDLQPYLGRGQFHPCRPTTNIMQIPTSNPRQSRKLIWLLSGVVFLAKGALAQSQPAKPAPAEPEEVITLSPFVVDAREDKGSYRANSTLAGTRVRTNLDDLASSISVVTQQFLQDTGAKDNQSLLVYALNTQVGGLGGNFAGNQAGHPSFAENTVSPQTNTRVRGLSAADNTRDYFITDIPADFFDVGRVDLQRGPNSILFGVGSPGGIINVSVNDANFRRRTVLENRVDGHGSFRQSADINYVVIPETLAIRVAALGDDEKFRQKPAFNDQRRIFAAINYQAELLGKGNRTSFRAKYENGKINANNPRSLPPGDQITSWFSLGKPLANAWDNPQGTTGVEFQSAIQNQLLKMNPGTYTVPQGNTYWPDVKSYFDSTTGKANTAPIKVVTGDINGNGSHPGFALNPAGIGDLPDARPFAVPPFSTLYANNNTPGGAYYSSQVITDPSIFNFYDNLLDGPNKREWQRWNATNVALSQTFFDGTLGFEFVYDRQRYLEGKNGFMSGDFYAISVEANKTYTDGTANPNVGRPYVAGYGSDDNNRTSIDRDSLRFTSTYEFRADKFLNPSSTLAKILGRSVFTGMVDRDQKKQKFVKWSQYATTTQWAADNNIPLGNLTQDRQFDWLTYLGDSILQAGSAKGANVGRILIPITPAGSNSVTSFDTRYNSTVSPTAPYSFYDPTNGSLVNGTQADNHLNYKGWSQHPVTWLDARNESDFPQLVTGGSKTKYVDNNQGFTWQGYLFEGALVPTLGYRKDRITSYTTGAPSNPSTSIAAIDYADNETPANRASATGSSRAWGGVFHLPKRFAEKLPWGTTLSLYYNHDENFKAETPQFSLLGDQQPNPSGKTKDYGVTISTLNNKLQLKVGHYSTTLSNDPIPANLGTPGYHIWANVAWGYLWAAQIQDFLSGKAPLSAGLTNYAAGDGVPGADAGPGSAAFDNAPQTALQKKIVDAWLNLPLPQSYIDFYQIHPVTINLANAKASGQLSDALGNGWIAGVTDNVAGGYSPGNQQPGPYAPVSTETTLSSGNEWELTAMPVPNWNISVNYSTINATRTGIDPVTTKLMQTLSDFYNGPGGQIRQWYNGGPTLGSVWETTVNAPYLTIVAQQGQRAPDLPKWQSSAVTTYSFDRGPLKGFLMGGAVRLESSRILGYRFDPSLFSGHGGPDVSKPWYGPTESHVDVWLGYRRKILSDKAAWRIQLNATNVGEKIKLIPAQIQPDGSLALGRIRNGMEWQLTNSFEF